MEKLSIIIFCIVNSLLGYSQSDSKPVVGIAQFTTEVETKYAPAVAEKVVQVVTNSRRFVVVDRTSYDKVRDELEFQKSEAFLDSKNTVKQEAALAAEYIIIGHILKMNLYTIKNQDGSINGYKASVAFNLKVNDVETGKTTEAEHFQSSVSPLMLSAESAVNEALNSVEADLFNYFSRTFPLVTRISKILTAKKNACVELLIAGGKSYGFKEGDRLVVERMQWVEGKPYPIEIGKIKIAKVAGDDFSECRVVSGGKEILSDFEAKEKIICRLLVD